MKKMPLFLYNKYMNIDAYGGLAIAGLLPVLMTSIFIFLDKKTIFNKFPDTAKQIIYGLFFGILAILGTEYGIPYNGAQTNVRDAAVLAAGLVFGAPAGIIAGLIGGIERYFAVYWGVGAYTQIACTASTIIAGFYSAALRKYMFDDHKPSWTLAFFIGLVMEVFHMTMVFLTNMSDTEHAMLVVKTCSIVMVPANALSTMLSVLVARYMSDGLKKSESQLSVSQTIQRRLLVCVAIMFALTSWFTYRLQTAIAEDTTEKQLRIAISDLTADIENVSANNLLLLTKEISTQLNKNDIKAIAENFGVAEINIIDKDGIIAQSTNDSLVGFNMYSGDQSKEFIDSLNINQEYVQEYGPISFDASVYRKYAGVKYKDGYLQVGYGAEEFQDDIANQVKTAAKSKHVGQTGYIIIADHDLNIVSAPEEHNYNTISQYGFDVNALASTVNTGIVDGQEVNFVYDEVEGYYIVSVLPTDEGFRTRNIAIYVNTFMEILAFAVFFALIYQLIKATVVDKIDDVNESLAKITDGDLNEVVKVNSNHEFTILSEDINKTVSRLKEYIAEANARIDAEIQYAKSIQENALPHVFPNDNKYEIFALMEAAKGVGGDFYDFYKTTRHGVNFMIADVSGKGIPGAMFMMRAKAELHTLTETGIPVNDVFTYGNNRLCEGNEAGMFVTAWEGNINLETGDVTFANAGHNPPVIMRTDGTCEYIRGKAGFVLAGMEEVQYKLQDLKMNEGDIIFLYTDGVVEATNANNELYGEERLLNCLKRIDRSVSMEYLCCEVIGDVGRFVGEAEQFDDITMLALKYKGNYQNN